jgi:hypothetical protein
VSGTLPASVGTNKTLWCVSLPLVGRRTLTASELAGLTERHARYSRPLLWASRARRALLGLACVGALALSFVIQPWPTWWIGRLFIGCAVMFLVTGVAASWLELVFGTRVSRVAFGVLWVVFVVALYASPGPGQPKPFLVDVGGSIGAIGLWAGGLLMLALRSKDHAEVWPRLIATRGDLATGEVFVFRGNVEEGAPYPAKVYRAGLVHDNTREQTIELLPGSGWVVSVNGDAVTEWITIMARETALVPDGVAEEATSDSGPFGDVEVSVAQRGLTSSELDELRGTARRDFRRDILSALGTAWVSGLIAARVCRGFGPPPPGVDVLGLSIVGVVALLLVGRAIWKRRFLMRVDGVAVLRPKVAVADAPSVVELLAGSRIVWTADGKPAPWRRVSSQ